MLRDPWFRESNRLVHRYIWNWLVLNSFCEEGLPTLLPFFRPKMNAIAAFRVVEYPSPGSD